MPEVEAKYSGERAAAGLGKFEDAQFPSRLQHSRKFQQAALVVRKVAEAESRCNEIETRVRERQIQGIRCRKNHGAPTSVAFLFRALQHPLHKITADYRV